MGHKNLLKDKRMKYNPQGTQGCFLIQKSSTNRFGNIAGKRPSHKQYTIQTEKNYPKSILRFPKEDKVRLHPTQKPVALLEYLIRTYTNPSETIIDNCMGSGSTGVACLNTGRDFIGIELDKEYFDISCKRIKETIEKNNIDCQLNIYK